MTEPSIWPWLQIVLLIALLLPAKRLVALGEFFGSLTAVLSVYFALLLAVVAWLAFGTESHAPRFFGNFQWSYLFQGLLWGVGLYILGIVGYILAQKVLGLQQPGEVQLFRSKGLSAMLVVGIILAGPILEEYVFRGLIFHNLINSVPVVGAVLISAAVFSLYHLSAFQLLPTFFWGLGFAVLAQWAESLWPVVIAHLLVNGLGFALFVFAPPKNFPPTDR